VPGQVRDGRRRGVGGGAVAQRRGHAGAAARATKPRGAREELEQAADEELVKSVTFRTSTAHRVKRIDEGKDEDFFEACLAEAVAQAQKQERATIATKSRHVTPVAADGKAHGGLCDTEGQGARRGGEGLSSGALLQLRRRQ
jgi:hypothetical protein